MHGKILQAPTQFQFNIHHIGPSQTIVHGVGVMIFSTILSSTYEFRRNSVTKWVAPWLSVFEIVSDALLKSRHLRDMTAHARCTFSSCIHLDLL